VEQELVGADYSEHMIGHDTMVTHMISDYVQQTQDAREGTPLSVISGKIENGTERERNTENKKAKDKNKFMKIRRGSCISRLSYQISKSVLIQHDKVTPLTSNEIPGQPDGPC
jgi:hypothetical protein